MFRQGELLMEQSRKMAKIAYEALDERKGEDIKIIDISEISPGYAEVKPDSQFEIPSVIIAAAFSLFGILPIPSHTAATIIFLFPNTP